MDATLKPKLYYFELYGKAESIRLLFYYAKQDFEDIQLTKAKFRELQSQGFFPGGQVPILEYCGKKFTQASSILRMLCQKYGYYPNDPDQIYDCECISDFRTDVMRGLIKTMWIQDEKEKKKATAVWFEIELPPLLNTLEAYYKKVNGGQSYFIGKIMTMADFIWIDFYTNVIIHPDRKELGEKTLESFPELKKYFETRVVDFKQYIEKRPIRPY